MSTEYTSNRSDAQREELARKIAGLRADGVPWDGPGGIVDSMRLVKSATQGRALLRKFKLDAKQGGPVEIKESYDRHEINPTTGRRRGHRERNAALADKSRSGAERPTHASKSSSPDGMRAQQPDRQVARPASERRPRPSGDPLIAFAEQIAMQTGRAVATPNPEGPTTRALALFVLRDPGATETSGANETGVLDPYLNRDPTSARQRAALLEAGIDPSVCVWWNASPFHLGYKGQITEHDCAAGARYLREFVALCRELRVVVAMGNGARDVATRAWRGTEANLPRLILAPHPMIYGRGGAERQAKLAGCLAEAARAIGGARAGL